jgi:hypothetical protein
VVLPGGSTPAYNVNASAVTWKGSPVAAPSGSPTWQIQSIYVNYQQTEPILLLAEAFEDGSGDIRLQLYNWHPSTSAWVAESGGPMELNGFGHGGACGLFLSGSDLYFCIECVSDTSGYGTAVMFYPYGAGETLSRGDGEGCAQYPLGMTIDGHAVTDVSCTTAVVAGVPTYFAMRFGVSGEKFIQAWSLSDALEGNWDNTLLLQNDGKGQQIPVLKYLDPAFDPPTSTTSKYNDQGWTFRERWAYLLGGYIFPTSADNDQYPFYAVVDLNGVHNATINPKNPAYTVPAYLWGEQHDSGTGEPEGTCCSDDSFGTGLIYTRCPNGLPDYGTVASLHILSS